MSKLDIKIVGGRLLDGTGAPEARLDVGICGDAIEVLGDLSAAEARVTIDAQGGVVCPGFIDAHSHSDSSLLVDPSAPSKTWQGVTTEVIGNCGSSAAPSRGQAEIPSDGSGGAAAPDEWLGVAEYRERLLRLQPGPNVAMLVGHGTLRKTVMGCDNRPATADELKGMKHLLARCMDEGARGLSTGLIYAPSRFAASEELVELARIAAGHGGLYASHMRSEGARLLEALREAIGIGEAAGMPVQISHFKTAGRANWGLLDAALELIHSARARGLAVAADRYPYLASYTDLDMLFPDWAAEGGREAVLARLQEEAVCARLREDLLRRQGAEYWPTITIGSTKHPDNFRFRGRLLVDAAKELGLEPVDAVIHFARSDELSTTAFFAGMCEENMFRIYAEPYVMIGSDASARAPTGPLSENYPHPRAYGTFPRFLRLALDGKTVALPEAIRKMTSLPAGQFGFKGRGTLARGFRADVTVFEPGRMRDKATFGQPHQLAEGVEHVIVNGVHTLERGRLTGRRGGWILAG